MVTVCISDTEADGQPSKSQRKGSVSFMKETTQLGLCPKMVLRRGHPAGMLEIGISSRSQVLQDHDASRKKS